VILSITHARKHRCTNEQMMLPVAVSECPDVKNYKLRLNPVWHRMLYRCTHMATGGIKRLILPCLPREIAK